MTHETNPTLVLGVLVVISALLFVHLARRYQLMNTRIIHAEDVSFTALQRAMHWTIGCACVVLVLTGLPVYLAQFLVIPSVNTPLAFYFWGLQVSVWRTDHIYLGLAAVGLVCLHATWDSLRLKAFGRMKVSRDDVEAAKLRAREFLALSSRGAYNQPTTRYDLFQRAFHWTLLVLGAFLLVSGLLMWDALAWKGVPLYVWLDRWNHTFMDGFMRTGHLVAAMVFAGLLVLHTYFALLPQNRPLVRSMTLGGPSREPAGLDSAGTVLPRAGGMPAGRAVSKFALLVVGLMGLIEVSLLYLAFLYPGFVLAPSRPETAYFWPFPTRQLYLDLTALSLFVCACLCFLTCLPGVVTGTTSRQSSLSRDRRYLLAGGSFAAFVPSIYFVVAPFNEPAGFAASLVVGVLCWLVLRKDNDA